MMSNKEKISLITYKCEKGIYFANTKIDYSGRNTIALGTYRVNKGEFKVENTWNKSWYLLVGADSITSVERVVYGGQINPRWELKDPEDVKLGIPLTISKEESFEYNDDYWCLGAESPYHKFNSFYRRVTDKAPDSWAEIDFEVQDKGFLSVNEVDNFQDMKLTVDVRSDRYTDYKEVKIEDSISNVVTYYELETLLTPDIALHNRPCYINADTAYRIIRHYVRTHIDGRYARITSDYDFCFTVKKLVHIKPYIHKWEIKKNNGRSYSKPKYNSRLITTTEVEVFEMCPSKKYNNYTPIDGFKGDNLADLIENVKLYLDELITYINAPLEQCSHCNGTGIKEIESV
jgi:hypothetical protein